jgi:pyrimidine operon attenuation protein/uracil phosphoribosyltransferase
MLSFEEKISYLQQSLNKIEENYADSFRTDILFFFDDFNVKNSKFQFLNKLHSFNEIERWITKLTSRIVMKEDDLEVNEIIFDYYRLG